MTTTLTSYVCGAWHTGTGTPRPLFNPTTDEQLAVCDSTGIDFAKVAAHARDIGGPALRAVGFATRAGWLKQLANAIHEHREELVELATKNGGNTRGDAKFDIDGATGTLAAYASFGKHLPDTNVLVDGDGVQLGRTARYWGQHVRVPRLGVAVHINAFNFPAWGAAEKMACALLAGIPVIEKPGTPSALVAWRMAQIVVESGVLPEGAFQFVGGGVGDLLDHLGPQDCLAFTGSAWTGRKLKAHPAFVERNARINIEADSLNSAILGPKSDGDTEVFTMFVNQVFTDMTQKCGQKCTAVRRILVPEDRVDEVREAIEDRIASLKIGDPSDGDNRMGPLASADALDDVLGGIGKLGEVADIVVGGPERRGDAGCFVNPTLLVAKDANADVLHELEVFGPVSTILPYSGSAEDAIALTNRGGGGLVASVFSNDKQWSSDVVLGIAPWHGRVCMGSDKVASLAMPSGMVLPQMVH
ncbi:MAG: 3,4-dehydroadipyl-CoA semialdehyde dehydrogenase, partial [Planctomycetes bacterium]|nr:3,4-dehydroadipyl-CoA semialdehyde dehydrogenase [Planctomycetota bacterium]